MNMTGDEVQSDLDAEFCQILYMIKPYINSINDHYRLEKYRVWLEKLSNSSAAEKLERNKYLVELANQIYDGDVRLPFTLNPPRGPLPPLKRIQVTTPINAHREEEPFEMNWPYFLPGKSMSSQSSAKRNSRSRDRSIPVRKFIKARTVARPFQTLGKVKDDLSSRNSETSSWCDMSESCTSVTMGCGDVDEEISKHQEVEKSFSQPSNTNEGAKSIIRQRAKEELEALRMRVEDLVEVKNALKETNVLSEDRKKTIDTLQNKVSLLEKEVAELKVLLESQQKKYAEMDNIKLKELGEFKQKLANARQKEIGILQQRHQEKIENLEKSHNTKMSEVEMEYQEKSEALKREYEEKIKQMTDSNVKLLNEKEMELCQLRNELQNRGDSALNDQNNEQIVILKRCLSKLDKALQKTEKDYVKKIEKLRQELEMRDMAANMQLQTQRAELLLKGSAAKQEEVKTVMENLEEKYKNMMETLQSQAMEARKYDEKRISELISILEKHNIIY